MSISLDHARHNKEAFEYIHSAAKYPDWAVTTAFYCSMHYAYAIMFPLTKDSVVYNNIEQFFNVNKKPNENKHSMTLNMVRQYHPTIGEKYKLLKDVAHTSRYHDYNVDPAVVSKVKRTLKSIEDYCEPICIAKDTPITPASL